MSARGAKVDRQVVANHFLRGVDFNSPETDPLIAFLGDELKLKIDTDRNVWITNGGYRREVTGSPVRFVSGVRISVVHSSLHHGTPPLSMPPHQIEVDSYSRAWQLAIDAYRIDSPWTTVATFFQKRT
ncbi:hypothetical protein EVAR_20914_1 [Eumeta japonica]|uniref:Uncharacterized protein n=1 Tax=Eumeta variegata TaxID=151549 RepID=A0A4C1UVE3_EUMVA|nr:hypothetical protein EVAR_20914_1 [Eumeta japonica]